MIIEINDVQIAELKDRIAEMFCREVHYRDNLNNIRWSDPQSDAMGLIKATTERETAYQILRTIGIYMGFDESVNWSKPCDGENVLFRYKDKEF